MWINLLFLVPYLTVKWHYRKLNLKPCITQLYTLVAQNKGQLISKVIILIFKNILFFLKEYIWYSRNHFRQSNGSPLWRPNFGGIKVFDFLFIFVHVFLRFLLGMDNMSYHIDTQNCHRCDDLSLNLLAFWFFIPRNQRG